MRWFNTEGECNPVDHYMLPAVPRLPGVRKWIERKRYFVVHAPRQTGKSTTLAALAEELTREGQHVALKFTCESGEPGPDEIGATELRVLSAVRSAAAARGFPAEWMPPDPWPEAVPGRRIAEGLQEWAFKCPLPLVLFFDEIDSLAGDSLNSVLRQLREGYSWRAHAFPASIGICGMRHLRDYKLAAGSTAPVRTGRGSPFNNAVTTRMSDFTAAEVAALYAQHTADTGQQFTAEAVDRAFAYSQGQPWLVNALAAKIIDDMEIEETITANHVDTAKELLIAGRQTHLDSLAVRLQEDRVRRVIEPIIAGTLPASVDSVYSDDVSYVRDLGLIAQPPPLQIANPIYREVIARVLGDGVENAIAADPHAFTLPDGQLDIPRLLAEFARFWVMNGDWMSTGTGYNEAGAQIVFMAFLHRMVNGDGLVDREFAIGSGRADIVVRRRYGTGQTQYAAFELKTRGDKDGDPLPQALDQFDGYLDRFGLDTGTVVIFDRRKNAPPIHERTEITTVQSNAGRTLTLLRA